MRTNTKDQRESSHQNVGTGLLTRTELARELKISTATVTRLVKQGLPHIPVGPRSVRFDRTEVVAWLKERKD